MFDDGYEILVVPPSYIRQCVAKAFMDYTKDFIKKTLCNAHYCPLQIFGWLLIGRFMTMHRILTTKWNSLLASEIIPWLGFANLFHSMTSCPPANNMGPSSYIITRIICHCLLLIILENHCL